MDEEQGIGADEFAAKAIDGNGVIGNYVVVAELINEDGTTLVFATSDKLTPWTADGMLNYVSKMLDASMFDYVEDPEEEV